MTKKKILLLTLMALLLVALAACGGNNAEPTSNAGDTGNTNDVVDDAGDDTDAGEEVAAGDATVGQELFVSTCSACHGPEGEGIEGLGKDMTDSEFIAGLSDAELLEFIKTGRQSSHPDNTTGVDMPPKGGNPALTDEQILDIIAYIREIHE